mmetsp:Transcript_36438/g.49292  ORF Transcript_36438/g.49292 Transcript_36438/m.49292 type:complete len:82 (+) Transcript_36438:65-310(+)
MLSIWASHADPSTPPDLGNINGFVHYQFFTDQSGWPLNAREMETALEFMRQFILCLQKFVLPGLGTWLATIVLSLVRANFL